MELTTSPAEKRSRTSASEPTASSQSCGRVEGDAVVFAHGHLLRVLAARWLGLEPAAGRLFALDVATISVLGSERETAVLRSWNWKPAER